jgi:hypothetical protein
MPQTPEPQQIPTAVIEITAKIDVLKRGQNPGQPFDIALPVEQRYDAILESRLLQGVDQLVFYPPRTDRVRREHDDEPVASAQGRPDFVVPLLRSHDIRLAEPQGYAVSAQGGGHADGEIVIEAAVREECLIGYHDTEPQALRGRLECLRDLL